MPLQTQKLVMAGLGIRGDRPPNSLQPPLVDGIHLRWAFQRDKGFPWHGFYLFRRRHRKGDPLCLSSLSGNLPLGPMPQNALETGLGTISSDQPLTLTDDFTPANVEFGLEKRRYLRFTLPAGEPVRKAEVTVGFREEAKLRVQALLEAIPVAEAIVEGKRGDVKQVRLEFDAITAIEVEGGPDAALIDLCVVPVSQDDREDWGIVERFTYPLGLPLTHPDYPCSGLKPEDLSTSRAGARQRILYGDPNQFTGPPATAYMAGTVSLTGGSPVVTGAGTAWKAEMAGSVLHVHGDATAYTVMMVPAPNKLLLSRPYGGPSRAGAPYELRRDDFGQLHDNLALLVQGGPAAGPMADRVIPAPVHSLGTVKVVSGSKTVTGVGTNWTTALRGLAFRIQGEKATYFVSRVESPTRLRLDRAYVGKPGAGRPYVIQGVLKPEQTGSKPVPQMPQQHPLDLVLLAALHPAVAQMVGLYWADQTADPDPYYDYLIVADYDLGLGDQTRVLSEIQQKGFHRLDGYIVFKRRMQPADPLSVPDEPRVYALPGAGFRSQSAAVETAGNAGLLWETGETGLGTLLPDKPVMYHIWRADLGVKEPAGAPLPVDYRALTQDRPHLVARPRLPAGKTPERAADWPPFPLSAIDSGLPEGWYSYQISSIDLFGRHSGNSAPGRWFQWAPAPDPRPWYYQNPEAHAEVHPFAMSLLDKVPPPPPTGVEAFALDPADPMLVRDAAYTAWWGALSAGEQQSLVGLRVRWLWTYAHMRQAPDTREFRIYYQPGQLNVRLGRTVSVAAAGAAESDVELDLPNPAAAGAYTGTRLRMGSDSFAVLSSQAGSPLRLRVRNLGPAGEIRPRAGAPCSVVAPEGHALHLNFSRPTAWQQRYYAVGYNDHVTVTTDSAGRPLRVYELFLPTASDAVRTGVPLTPTLAEPVAYAQVGVTAADDKTHTADSPQWAGTRWGGRTGNESGLAAPATIFRVRREQPDPPVVLADSERVYATPADYHGRSFYTYRWQPAAHLATHIFRALDDAVFRADWAQRPRTALSASDAAFFPAPAAEPRWDLLKRQQVAGELNHLNTFAHTAAGTAQAMACYRGLSNDALRVLAGLPGTEKAFSQVTIQPLDARNTYIDTLDGRAQNRFFYRAAFVDAAHNRSKLSLSGPPVWLHKVVPPRTHSLTKILGGDRAVLLRWASNREPDLSHYEVYRAETAEAARDIRLMALVHTEPAAADPGARPAEVTYTDAVTAQTTFCYRVVAVDTTGNKSDPSPSVSGRAYDDSRPVSPTWNLPVPGPATDTLLLSWTSPDATLSCLVQRRPAGAGDWTNISAWLPRGTYTFTDNRRSAGVSYEYRLRVLDSRGRQNQNVQTVTA